MIVTCEGCEKKFRVDEHRLKPSGSRVKCKVCQHIFVAYPPPADGEVTETINLTDEVPAAGAEPFPDASPGDLRAANLDAWSEEEAASPEAPEEPTPQSLLATVTLPDDLQLDLNRDYEEQTSGVGPPQADEDFSLRPEPALEEELAPLAASIDSASRPDAPEGVLPLEEPPPDDELELNLAELDEIGGPPPEAEAEAEVSPEELELDLDLDGLVLDVEGRTSKEGRPSGALESADSPPLENAAPAELELELDEELSLAGSGSVDQAAAREPDGDELDLSDLEAILEGAGGGAAKAGAGSESIDLELELDSAVPAGGPTAPDETLELDLAAIAGEVGAGSSSAASAGKADQEPELDFDLEPEPAAAADSAAAEPPADEKLDFTELTGILEPEKGPAAEEGPEISDLDLLLEDDKAAEPVAEADPSDTQRDLLADIEALLKEEAEPSEKEAPAASTDMEIEFDAPESAPAQASRGAAAAASLSPEGKAVTDEFATDEFSRSDIGGATSVLDLGATEEAIPAEEAEEPAAASRSGLRRPLFAALGAALLGLIALIVLPFFGVSIPYLSDLGIQVPGIGTLFKAEPDDPAGNLRMIPLAEKISAEFVENAAAGRLCVIRGEVRNGYDHPRSAIRVTSKLYTQDKAVAKTASVYAGNVISREELATLDLIAINNRFTVKGGAGNSNVNVPPGGVVPFMVVFSNLPANLDEYSVEVAGSTK